MIDASIGADKAKFVLHNDRARPCAQYFPAFAKNELNKTRVLVDLSSQLDRSLGGCYGDQVYRPPFRLGNDLLGKDKDILVAQRQVVLCKRT